MRAMPAVYESNQEAPRVATVNFRSVYRTSGAKAESVKSTIDAPAWAQYAATLPLSRGYRRKSKSQRTSRGRSRANRSATK